VPVDVSLALKEALHLVRASLPVTITLKEQMRCRSRTIMADPTEIHQVIINLCTNAAQAMENTGGVITVTLDRVVLSDEDARKESLLLAGPYIMITVSDTGAGIEKQHIERIFDPFFTTREIGSGSGLGLAVVHGIVSRHGGKISVESEPGNGAKFTVYFREAENAPKQLLTPATTPAGGNERILLVDDELLVVEVTRRRLELLGYQVSSYTRSDEALECFLRQPDAFDCIITDQTMPKMTGEQLTRAVLDVRPDIPVILCTGYSALVDAEKAEKIGVKAFVLKPFDQKNLAHTVRTVLDGSRVTATA
jgi:CheY-like chemotaxis protein/anti-sigma regulatory factor (Ser/Thr protein kinase)